ncbi:MAG: M20 family metallopeptidase [Anaerolineae bacterium]|nr:M20 family metallopeptidase [Anaerolineae bacterium]
MFKDWNTYFDDRTPPMLDLLRKLVEFESPSHDKPRVDALGRFVQAQMSDRRANLRRYLLPPWATS